MMMPIAPWLAALLIASLKGSLLLLVALGAVRLMRRSSAESRHAALAVALGAFFILPLAGLIAPAWNVPVLPPPSVDGPASAPAASAPGAAPAEPIAPEGSRQNPATGGSDLSRTSSSNPRATTIPALRDRIDWPLTLVAIWIAGSALIVLRLLVGITRLQVLSHRATMVTDGGWLHTAHALARRLGLTRGVTLLRGDREAVPMTWGVLSPVVWLPPASDQWPSDLRRAVLSHELAHVRRRDAATQWLANVVVAVHWFNPLVWITVRALRAERERACDDAVLSLGVVADDYASQLLDMVRTIGDAGGPAPAMAMARRSQFEGRLLAILDRAVSRGPVGSARLTMLAAMAIALVLLLGGMRAVASEGGATAPSAGVVASMDADARMVEQPPPAPAPAPPVDRPVTRSRPAAGARVPDSSVSAPKSPATPAPIAADSTAVPRTDAGAPPAATPSALIEALQETRRPDTTLMLEIIAAAEGISSNADRVAVLERMARRPNLEPEVVSALGAAAGRVTSTTERTKLLKALVQTQDHTTSSSRRAILDAIGTMTSSPEQASLLSEFIARPDLSERALSDALATSEKIVSNNERARTLVAAARLRRIEGEARASYLMSARTITSDSERARALSALFDGPGTVQGDRVRPPPD